MGLFDRSWPKVDLQTGYDEFHDIALVVVNMRLAGAAAGEPKVKLEGSEFAVRVGAAETSSHE